MLIKQHNPNVSVSLCLFYHLFQYCFVCGHHHIPYAWKWRHIKGREKEEKPNDEKKFYIKSIVDVKLHANTWHARMHATYVVTSPSWLLLSSEFWFSEIQIQMYHQWKKFLINRIGILFRFRFNVKRIEQQKANFPYCFFFFIEIWWYEIGEYFYYYGLFL